MQFTTSSSSSMNVDDPTNQPASPRSFKQQTGTCNSRLLLLLLKLCELIESRAPQDFLLRAFAFGRKALLVHYN